MTEDMVPFQEALADWDRQIIEDHPLLFKQCKYLEIHQGWASIVYDLSSKLEALIKDNESPDDDIDVIPCAAQVKEKWGGLRFYMYWSTDEMEKLIREAELLCKVTCAVCGKPGTLKGRSWWYVSCEDHRRDSK